MKLKDLLRSGLWPFTPDPVAPGVYQFGTPVNNAPVLITSNSRHTLAILRRILSSFGGQVLAIDVGGVDVHTALASGAWSLDKIAAAIESLSKENAAYSSAESKSLDNEQGDPVSAILPYPVWEYLVGEKGAETQVANIKPGPANARDLPAYFARGCQLTEEMKILKYSWRDRLSLSLAQAGIFCLGAALPMLAFGWREMVIGAGAALISAILFAAIYPYMPGKNFWLKRVPLVLGLPMLSVFLGWAFGFSPLALLYLGLATFVGAGWITTNIHLQ